ncbi:hypothetical protein DFH07DRAFT_756365, partial [Mycena maculata]
EPKESPKPQPMGGNMPMIFLVTTCTLCFLFILWRRASALRSVISHQLKTISHPEGAIRLSEDDGPPAHDFLEDDYDDDNGPTEYLRHGRELHRERLNTDGQMDAPPDDLLESEAGDVPRRPSSPVVREGISS